MKVDSVNNTAQPCFAFLMPQLSRASSFTFNLGGGALQRSTLRRKVNREEHEEVPRELMRWVWGPVAAS